MKLSFNKASNIKMLIVIGLCLFTFSSHLYAQTLSNDLTQAELLSVQNPNLADKKLRQLESTILKGSNTEKLHWLSLSLTVAANQIDLPRLAQIKEIAPALLSNLPDKKATWLTLFDLTIQLIKQQPTLDKLQAIEEQVTSFNDPFMSAFFYRSLYYSFNNDNIIDVALDIAIKNQKQWLAIEEHFMALEMQFNIIRIRANMMGDPQTDKLIAKFKKTALKLDATIYHASLTQLKASWLIQQGEPQEAYNLLNDLLNSNKETISKNSRLNTLYALATITFQLKKYQETVDITKEVISKVNSNSKSQQSINSAKVILASALIELENFQEAAQLVDEIEQNLTADNVYQKFQIDNIKIDMLYKSRNIDALYQTTKDMVKSITAPRADGHIDRRIKRAKNAAYVEEQSKVVEALAEDNITQQVEIDLSKQLIAVKDHYLLILSIFCLFLIGLFIWLVFLLRKIKVLANIDSLTGISNRRHGMIQAEKFFKHFISNTNNGAFAVVIMDLDFFKKINDTYGHAVGDEVIKLSVNTAKKFLTKSDIFCRMGGEEFLFIITGEDQQVIEERLNQIRAELANVNPTILGMNSPITASFGLTFVTMNSKALSDYIIEADNALYQAKDSGRNQVSRFEKS